MAVGAASVAGSVTLFWVGRGKAATLRKKVREHNSEDPPGQKSYDEIQQMKRQLGTIDALTVVAAGVGLAALGVGTLLYLTGDDPHRYDATISVGVAGGADASQRRDLSVALMPGGVALSGRF